MFVLQVTLTSLIHKMAKKTPAGQTIYRILSSHIYGGLQIYLDIDADEQRGNGGCICVYSLFSECHGYIVGMAALITTHDVGRHGVGSGARMQCRVPLPRLGP